MLSRDQAAVAALRAELTARRDAAAAALAFEFARKLQAELEAVDWIAAEQKVARAQGDQDDADVYGWADGVLVRFEIRGGRMHGWRQHSCAAAAARRYLEQSLWPGRTSPAAMPNWRPGSGLPIREAQGCRSVKVRAADP